MPERERHDSDQRDTDRTLKERRPAPARRRLRRQTIVAVGILVAALAVVAAVYLFAPSGGFRVESGEAASDYLLRCSQRFERAAYDEAYGLCQIAIAKPARRRIHIEAARRMALVRLAQGQTAAALSLLTTLEGPLEDRTSGAIRGAVLHAAGRPGAALAAYRACTSRLAIIEALRREAEAGRRLTLTHDTLMAISRIRCG